MNNITFGDETLGYYETVAGGAGAVSENCNSFLGTSECNKNGWRQESDLKDHVSGGTRLRWSVLGKKWVIVENECYIGVHQANLFATTRKLVTPKVRVDALRWYKSFDMRGPSFLGYFEHSFFESAIVVSMELMITYKQSVLVIEYVYITYLNTSTALLMLISPRSWLKFEMR